MLITFVNCRHTGFGESTWNVNRGIHTSRQVWDALSIVVPSMGDSVSEGSIAAILKQPGEIRKLVGIIEGMRLSSFYTM